MRVMCIFLSVVIVCLLVALCFCKQKIKRTVAEAMSENERAEINNELKKILAFWLEERDKGKTLDTYFEERNIHQIAIYGMAELGKLLYKELKGTNIKVVYGIDRKPEQKNIEIPVVKPSELKEGIDAIVVTPVYCFAEIFDLLKKKLDDSTVIIGLDEIIYSLMLNETKIS